MSLHRQVAHRAIVSTLGLFPLACDAGVAGDETEVISRVELRFTPEDGGDVVVAAFDDPDGDGGVSGSFDDIVLSEGTTYDLSITFINALEDPPEDVTAEVEAEAEEHLVLIYGDVDGPAANPALVLATQQYGDLESDYGPQTGDDLPVGLVHRIEATTAGSGDFSVMLRHLPPLNDESQKSAGIPESFAAGDDIPGDADVDLRFNLIVE